MEAGVEDDVNGSGVFSDECNLHVGDGVFSTSFAMPGYAYREDGRGKSEVIDHQTKTPVEVYMGGSTRGQQYQPSTQPRWPSPDLDPFWDDGRRTVASEEGSIRAVDTSFNPHEGAYDANPLDGRFNEHLRMPSAPVLPANAPLLPPRPIGALRLPAKAMSGLGAATYVPTGFGSYYRSPVAGLGFLDEVTSLPTWQLALLGLGVGVVASMLWKEFGQEFLAMDFGPTPPPQTPWQALSQPAHLYSAYPAAAHELLEPHSTYSRYPAAAYLTSAVRKSAMAPLRTFITASQDERAAIGADPEMVAALGLGAGVLLFFAAASMAGGYFAGRAMAPTKDERNAYGIGTALASAFLGPWGFLGAAGYSVSKQRLPMSYELLSGLGTTVDLNNPDQFKLPVGTVKCNEAPAGFEGNCYLGPSLGFMKACTVVPGRTNTFPCYSLAKRKVETGMFPVPSGMKDCRILPTPYTGSCFDVKTGETRHVEAFVPGRSTVPQTTPPVAPSCDLSNAFTQGVWLAVPVGFLAGAVAFFLSPKDVAKWCGVGVAGSFAVAVAANCVKL